MIIARRLRSTFLMTGGMNNPSVPCKRIAEKRGSNGTGVNDMAADLYADYVIVGAGSAGCVLAARLTESGEHKVVLLEAGGDDRPLKEPSQLWSNVMIHTPIGFGKTLNDPKVNWLYETEVDPGTGNRPHKWPKGKVLGGSSSINGLLYVRGQSADNDNLTHIH